MTHMLCFRGDSRSPDNIFKTGFHPNTEYNMQSVPLTPHFNVAPLFPIIIDPNIETAMVPIKKTTYIYAMEVPTKNLEKRYLQHQGTTLEFAKELRTPYIPPEKVIAAIAAKRFYYGDIENNLSPAFAWQASGEYYLKQNTWRYNPAALKNLDVEQKKHLNSLVEKRLEKSQRFPCHNLDGQSLSFSLERHKLHRALTELFFIRNSPVREKYTLREKHLVAKVEKLSDEGQLSFFPIFDSKNEEITTTILD